MKRTKTQVKSIVLPNGTTAATRSHEVALNSEFAYCLGFYIIVNKNAGNNYLRSEIRDSTGASVVDMVNIKHLESTQNPPIKDRFFRESPFEAGGKLSHININNPATITGGDVEIDVVFLLGNELPQ